MEHERFKVNVLVVNDEVGDFLFMANFNVPEPNLYDGSLPARLDTIRAYVSQEFQSEIQRGRVLFCVSATYRIIDTVTGEDRFWAGSFQPRANRSTLLRPFRRFAPDNFLAEAAAAVDPVAVGQTLDWVGEDTKWSYQGLHSAIFCFQARCRRAEHPFLPSLLVPQNKIAKLTRERATAYKLYMDN